MKGKFLYTDNQEWWISKGRHLFKSSDNGDTWRKEFSIPCNLLFRLCFKFPLITRLLRLGVHHFIKVNDKGIVCVFNKEIIWIDSKTQTVIKRDRINGSRPLSFILHKEYVLYGEYRGNSERSAVNVWRASVHDKVWESVLTLKGIRHIHGVYSDLFSDSIWVTTGDENKEARIIIADSSFSVIETFMEGDQQCRIVQPVFTEQYIYYASDAPDELNYIYRYDRSLGRTIKMKEVGGPVYFGQYINGVVFFSTVVEPSCINSQTSVELWALSQDGTWYRIKKFKKDYFSMKYFQYGQLIFPSQQFDDQFLCFTEFATTAHLKMHQINVNKLNNKEC